MSYNLKRGDHVNLYWDGKLGRCAKGTVIKATAYYSIISFKPWLSCSNDLKEIKVRKNKRRTGLLCKSIIYQISGYMKTSDGKQGAYYTVKRVKKELK